MAQGPCIHLFYYLVVSKSCFCLDVSVHFWEWSGGAMVLGKLPVPGASYNLDYSRARAYCTYSRRGWGYLDIFIYLKWTLLCSSHVYF